MEGFAMLEGTIPFAAVCIPICLALGYDVITGISVVFIADIVGWSAGPANYYTVGNAQIIGGLKLFSGFSYRMVALVVLGLVSIFYVIRYAEKVRKDPSKGLMAGQDYSILGDQRKLRLPDAENWWLWYLWLLSFSSLSAV
ncbi:MAG: hypothetical protein ACLTAF_06035 [Blautia coccoides]